MLKGTFEMKGGKISNNEANIIYSTTYDIRGCSGGENHENSYENVSQEVQTGENVPDTELETPIDELVKAVLTPEEQELAEDGAEIKIVLIVVDVTSTVSAEDKEKVETAISGLSDSKVGQYLDVSLLKIIGDSQEKITETNAPITIVFELTGALRGERRTYSIIRIHNGETTVLTDLDSNINTLTIKTDKFSTYALVYSEKTNTTPPGSGDTAPDESGTTDGSGSEPSESTPADVSNINPAENEPTNASNSASGENNSTNGGDTLPENGGSLGNGTAALGSEASNANNNGTDSDGTSGNGSGSASGGSLSADNNGGNPSTGAAISFIPLMAITVIMAASEKSKKK